MRLESIEIKNFRQYQHAELYFKQVPGKPDIHIILGENGEGKTNILNAITWCLYGEETHLGDRNNALPLINSQYVNQQRLIGKDTGNVQVTIDISTEEGNIRFMRSATFSIFSDPIVTDESLGVLDNKMNYHDDEETVSSFIYRYVPQDINDYIFFDGEQLDEYFKEGKREKIELGIKDLTQASIVKKTIDGFKKYLKAELIPTLNNADDSKVKDAQKKVNDLEGKVQISGDTVNELYNQKKQCETKIQELNDIIKGHENYKEKAIRLEELEKELDRCREQIDQKNTELMRFVREYYVLFALYPSMKKYYDYIQKQEKAGNLPPKVDKKLVESILETKECPICGATNLSQEQLEFVKNVLKRLEFSSKTSNCLNKAATAIAEYFKKISEYDEKKKRIQTDLAFIEEQKKKYEKEYKEISDFMKTIADSDKLTKAFSERETLTETRESLIKKIAIEENILVTNEKAFEEAQKELDKALFQNKAYAKLRKQKNFCEDSIKLLEKAMEQVLNDCRNELQDRTFEIFNSLMWKKDTFKEVIIDEDYIFHLKNIFNEETLGSCSAAERGLLALSFTMALQEISRHDSLLYIDTPLGRVGNKNRINFANILKEIASEKQVILSFTPSEYDANVKKILEGNYSTYHDLVYSNGITTINRIK